jgi:5'-AMP-activated protein kinase, regulatory gamma subunit
VLPLSFRLIVFDTALSIKESLNILVQNGASPPAQPYNYAFMADFLVGIVSAPLWDSRTSTFAGLLTTSDYINVIQYYWQNPTKLSEIDGFTLTNLRGKHRKPHSFRN